jgi:hypothetical protein
MLKGLVASVREGAPTTAAMKASDDEKKAFTLVKGAIQSLECLVVAKKDVRLAI